MGFESSNVLLSVKCSKEADRYAPWVEASNIALQILKTVNVDDIRGASPLNILAQRNDLNEVPTSHGSDGSFRKPDVVFMTEQELIEVHNLDKAASGWQNTLYRRCENRLPPKTTVLCRQFKAMVEVKRGKGNDDSSPMTFPEALRSCREGSDLFVKSRRLGGSVAHVDDAPAPPGSRPEEEVEEAVPKACTFYFHSSLF